MWFKRRKPKCESTHVGTYRTYVNGIGWVDGYKTNVRCQKDHGHDLSHIHDNGNGIVWEWD